MRYLTDLEKIIWAAGWFEGEGCFGLDQPPNPKHRSQIYASFVSTDRDVVEYVHQVLNISTCIYVTDPNNSPSTTTLRAAGGTSKPRQLNHRVKCNGAEAERVMRILRPYMGARRGAKIDELLAMKNLSHHPKTAK